MGCDGGTIPRRDELVRLKKKPEQVILSWTLVPFHVFYDKLTNCCLYFRKTRSLSLPIDGVTVPLHSIRCKSPSSCVVWVACILSRTLSSIFWIKTKCLNLQCTSRVWRTSVTLTCRRTLLTKTATNWKEWLTCVVHRTFANWLALKWPESSVSSHCGLAVVSSQNVLSKRSNRVYARW